MKKIALTTLV